MTLPFGHHLGLRAMNMALHAVHLFVIGFSVVGWMFDKTRLANLVLLALILFSWYGLGPLMGQSGTYGYCVITDLQWSLRRRLGLEAPPGGYMTYLGDRLTGHDVNALLVDRITAAVFLLCLIGSAATTIFHNEI